jgi:RNA polymerase subunit RPABC4/transcription elongation factor Spt4
MKMAQEIAAYMLAPCGVNCAVCYVHLRKKKACEGCRGADGSKPNHCRNCKIQACVSERGLALCVDCEDFPCGLIKRMDKSYRQRYQLSLVENARRFREIGGEQFMREEVVKWTCAACGGAISQHDRICTVCGKGMGLKDEK